MFPKLSGNLLPQERHSVIRNAVVGTLYGCSNGLTNGNEIHDDLLTEEVVK